MESIVNQLGRAFRAAIQKAVGFDADPLVAPSQNLKFGDYQCNAAMGLVKKVSEATGEKANPRAIAEKIMAALELEGMAEEISIAGPGFINVRLSKAWISTQLAACLAEENLGVPRVDQPATIVVDYSGPNIAKQMHVGHLRSTIIGDSISRVLEFLGNRIVRQNHLGDWGTQFGMLITHLRSGGLDKEAHIADLEVFYQEAKRRFDEDPAFQDAARAAVVRLQGGETEERTLWLQIVDETRRHYQPIYDRLGVLLKPEHERGESFYNPFLADTVAELKSLGIAVESEGAVAIFVEGFEAPLIIEKSGGGYLYGTTDLAAIRFRIRELGAQRIIYTHDSRQAQHFNQVFDAARRAKWGEGVVLEFAPFGTMLGEDGRPFKTREGGTVKLRDLLDEAGERAFALVTEKKPDLPEEKRREIAREVGIGAIKYSDLSKDRTGDYVFSWDSMLSMDGNTGPYLQYAHTRVCSVLRRAKENGVETGDTPVAFLLDTAQELALARHVLRFGEVIEIVGRELKPHHLCAYLYQLATLFSSFYENCPVLDSGTELRNSRLRLCEATGRTMAQGLQLLGIPHPEQM